MSDSAQIHIGALSLDVGLLNASGIVDVVSSTEEFNLPDEIVAKLGAFVTKTITLEPRLGHPQPIIARWGSGSSLVNAVGLMNPGLQHAIELWRDLPRRLGIPVIASVDGAEADVAELVGAVSARSPVAAIELNLSCPNVTGGLVASDPAATGRAVAAARAATSLPIIAKLTPASGRVGDVVRAAEAAGVDAICCGNTMPVIATDATGAPLLGAGVRAGLSGVDLHPMALRLVADAAAATTLPIIGLGGIDSPAAIQRMRSAGAVIFGVGTAAWYDWSVIGRLAEVLGVSATCVHD
jgi:dihydroorotate dehydrogenase (NAD+) catalytic subunit